MLQKGELFVVDRSLPGVLHLPDVHLGRLLNRCMTTDVGAVYVRGGILVEAKRIWLALGAVGEFCSGRDPLVGRLERDVPLVRQIIQGPK